MGAESIAWLSELISAPSACSTGSVDEITSLAGCNLSDYHLYFQNTITKCKKSFLNKEEYHY